MKISELKKEAKIKLNGKMKKAFCIYLITSLLLLILCSLSINILVNILHSINIKYIFNTLKLISIILLPFSFGILVSMIKLSRNENTKIIDFLKIGANNFINIFKIYLLIIIKLWLPIVLYFICNIIASLYNFGYINNIFLEFVALLLSLITLIIFITKSLSYSLALYIFYDNPKASFNDILIKSEKLMKGNKVKIVLLDFSFIGWVLLIFSLAIIAIIFSELPILVAINKLLSFGLLKTNLHTLILIIGFLLLEPYMAFSKITFYEELNSNSN